VNAPVVSATLDRPRDLQEVLEDLRIGTCLPREVRVVDASSDRRTEAVCALGWAPLVVNYVSSPWHSAARQRNLGAAGCATDIVVFCDDDVRLPANALELLLDVFEGDSAERIGGVAGTINGLHHHPPRRLLRWYFSLMARYTHADFGGQLFGPAINVLPTDRPSDPLLYPSQWLNSTLVGYRTSVFERECFPEFEGYSFQEDVHLSARIARTHALVFHRGLRYEHKAAPAPYKSDQWRLARMELEHRWLIATTILELDGRQRLLEFALLILLNSAVLLRGRPHGWARRLLSTWLTFGRLAFPWPTYPRGISES
jgi:hypothetical protein